MENGFLQDLDFKTETQRLHMGEYTRVGYRKKSASWQDDAKLSKPGKQGSSSDFIPQVVRGSLEVSELRRSIQKQLLKYEAIFFVQRTPTGRQTGDGSRSGQKQIKNRSLSNEDWWQAHSGPMTLGSSGFHSSYYIQLLFSISFFLFLSRHKVCGGKTNFLAIVITVSIILNYVIIIIISIRGIW